jgi:hypothetical protein
MKITGEMKIKEVLKFDERKMIQALVWLAPEFERLRNAAMRKVMANRVTVEQAARVAKLPLSEMLYVLNLAAGEDHEQLRREFDALPVAAFRAAGENPPRKPRELLNLKDDEERVHFLDMMTHAEQGQDPLPVIMHATFALRSEMEVLLVRHPFDPVPLRDLLARRRFSSWAEERRPCDWYIYFYRPRARAAATAHPPVTVEAFVRAVAAGSGS